jgi:hypothetical protein
MFLFLINYDGSPESVSRLGEGTAKLMIMSSVAFLLSNLDTKKKWWGFYPEKEPKQ